MVSVFASSGNDRGIYPHSGQSTDYKIGSCYFSAKNTELNSKNKDRSARNKDHGSEGSDISTRGLLFQ